MSALFLRCVRYTTVAFSELKAYALFVGWTINGFVCKKDVWDDRDMICGHERGLGCFAPYYLIQVFCSAYIAYHKDE